MARAFNSRDAEAMIARQHPGIEFVPTTAAMEGRVYRSPEGHAGDPGRDEPSAVSEKVAQRAAEELARTAATIEEGIRAVVGRRFDPRRAATVLWATWNGLIAMHMRQDELGIDDREPEELLGEAREMLVLGMLALERR